MQQDQRNKVRNEKARRYLSSMRKKDPVPFSQKFPSADPLALKLLEKLLAFDPKDRPTAEEALCDPYFKGLARVEREPSCQPIRKVEFDFEHKRMSKEEIRELIFREILEYHPQLLNSYINGTERTTFLYPSAVDQFKKQFSHLEESGGNSPSVPTDRKHASLPRTTVVHSNPIPAKEQPLAASSRVRPVSDDSCKNPWEKGSGPGNVPRASLAPQGLQAQAGRRGLLDQVGSPMRYPSDNATTTAVVNSTALDGSKFTLIFCVLRLCGKRDCYCCETGDYCYYSRKQCQANCDSCDPKCPPPRLPLQ
ncbi:unnamed protein product [Miscanthus lutarioriparius]|uniref:Uncharacterized protein n=1 Tax=Miscanthus lutarioriparius TaxID=422564 RepID=A0A811RUW3_9POAL|nr:unnamed protein product [Miscanthus lutarioriparius]